MIAPLRASFNLVCKTAYTEYRTTCCKSNMKAFLSSMGQLGLKMRFCSSSDSSASSKTRPEMLRNVMRKVPQPVVVVTSASDATNKRGITCSSFTAISLDPPIVSFAVNRPSRMHNLLLKTRMFAVHVLTQNQVRYGLHFAKPAVDGVDQFDNIPHEMDPTGTPILRDTAAVLLCRYHSVDTVGDHEVWYGEVERAYTNATIQHPPLLYYASSFRSIGDEAFMKAFEDATLPFEDWTHEAHLRMAFNYIRQYGCQEATPHIKKGILRYNEENKDKISRGYHETVTIFYIHVVSAAMETDQSESFDDFIQHNQHLMHPNLLFEYYSDQRINQNEAKVQFLPPDKKPLP